MSSENNINRPRGRPRKENASRKTFKDYYADPEFRRRHLEKLNEKVCCDICSAYTAKTNRKRHQRSHLCQNKENATELKKLKRKLKKYEQ